VDALFRSLVKYEGQIYIILGLLAFFALRKLWLAWVEWRKAVFGLEKELAFQKLRVSSSITILLTILTLSQFCLVTFVMPFLPSITFRSTATPNLLTTLDNGINPTPSSPPAATPAPDSLFVPGASSNGCIPGQIEITFPLPGQEVSSLINLTGTVNIPNFGFYKYEYTPQGTETWITIAAGRELKQAADLGPWDPSILTPGDYELRLVVVDTDGTIFPSCVVPVRVVEIQQP
jgi:hypothetical protein